LAGQEIVGVIWELTAKEMPNCKRLLLVSQLILEQTLRWSQYTCLMAQAKQEFVHALSKIIGCQLYEE